MKSRILKDPRLCEWVSLGMTTAMTCFPPPSSTSNSLAVVLVLNKHQKWAWSSGGKTTPRCYSTWILKGTPRDLLTPGPWRKTDNNGQVGQCVWGAECRRFAVGKGGTLKCRDGISHFGWWYCICCIPGKVSVDRYVGNIGNPGSNQPPDLCRWCVFTPTVPFGFLKVFLRSAVLHFCWQHASQHE